MLFEKTQKTTYRPRFEFKRVEVKISRIIHKQVAVWKQRFIAYLAKME